MQSIKLNTQRLILRHGQIDDIPAILNYFTENQAHLAPYEPLRPPGFFTSEFWAAQLPQRLEETASDRSLKLFIFRKEQPTQIIGTLNFSSWVRGVFQCSTVGYSLAKTAQGNGYMNEALHAGIKELFEVRHFHRISANYIPHNRRSGHVLKRLGFTVEGYARDYLYINGKWQDHILTSLTNPNAPPPQPPAPARTRSK